MALITSLRNKLTHVVKTTGELGASLVEYTLLVALIAVVAIGAIGFLGRSAESTLDCAGQSIAGTAVAPECAPAEEAPAQ